MNTSQLKWPLALLVWSMAFASCKKPENFERKGVINRDVLFTCAGCTGSSYDIKFANDTLLYHIANDLTQFGITANSNFPVNVSVNAKPDNTAASNFVIITALKEDN